MFDYFQACPGLDAVEVDIIVELVRFVPILIDFSEAGLPLDFESWVVDYMLDLSLDVVDVDVGPLDALNVI